MSDAMIVEPYQESRIEDEPILGPVLAMPDGSFKRLSWLERVLVRFTQQRRPGESFARFARRHDVKQLQEMFSE